MSSKLSMPVSSLHSPQNVPPPMLVPVGGQHGQAGEQAGRRDVSRMAGGPWAPPPPSPPPSPQPRPPDTRVNLFSPSTRTMLTPLPMLTSRYG